MTGPNEEEYLRINVIAVPENGKANKELTVFLAKKLNVAKSNITLISGSTNHWKKLLISANEQIEPALIKLNGDL